MKNSHINTDIKKVAYLAPELPSLSATFVYNEILTMENMGVTVFPYSVHRPKNQAQGKTVEKLAKKTAVVYEQRISAALGFLLINFISHKRSSIKSLGFLVHDILKTGAFQKQSVKLIYQFIKAGWLARELRKNNIQHLHIHFGHVPAQIGMYAAVLAGIPFTFTTHANDLFERALLLKEKVQRSKKAVTISSYNKNLLIDNGSDRRKISVVRCGVNSSFTSRNGKIERDNKPFIIGSLGRLVEKKGMDTLIEAAVYLRQKNIDFRIEIAGSGPMKSTLIEKIRTTKLSDKVRLTGAVSHDKAMRWMRGLDLFVLACRADSNGDKDGIPVVLMEAMNAGVPVISTYLSGIPELIKHRFSGFLSLPDDAQSLAGNIGLILQNEKLRKKLIKNAKNRIDEEFGLQLNVNRLLTIIKE